MIYGARLFAGLLAAGLLFAPMSAGADDLKIVPGERIGDVSVNMRIEEVLRILGNPSSVDRHPRFATYEWRSRLSELLTTWIPAGWRSGRSGCCMSPIPTVPMPVWASDPRSSRLDRSSATRAVLQGRSPISASGGGYGGSPSSLGRTPAIRQRSG